MGHRTLGINMKIETTDGKIYIKIGQCDCGLTAGCEKCQTKIIKGGNYEKRKEIIESDN